MKIIEHPKDPVFVASALDHRRVLLYIGERRRGKTRIARITTKEARKLAYALMSLADKRDEQFLQATIYAAWHRPD